MKETEKLIQILTKFGPQKLPLLEPSFPNNGSLENRLYENIKAGKYKHEEEAMLDLYDSEEDYHKYRMLKSRLKQKLFNHLLFVENDTVVAKKEEKNCLDMLHKGNLLLLVGELRLAEKCFKRVISSSEKFEFTHITVKGYENLYLIYLQSQNQSAFIKAEKKLEYYRRLKAKEDEAMKLYFTSKMKLTQSIASKRLFEKKIPPIIQTLKKMWLDTGSFNVFQWYYFLENWYLKLTMQYEGCIEGLERCEKLVERGDVNVRRFDSRANKYSHISALFHSKQYEKGLALAKSYVTYFDPFSRNWFAFMEYYFLMALHTEKYHLASELMLQVNKNPFFSRLKPKQVESWSLYAYYLGIIHLKEGLNDQYTYQQLLNSFPIYSKDKLGHNISIRILQFLWLLKNRDYEHLISKEETYRKYADSYLNDPYSRRSYYLFKMMLCIIRTDFDLEKSMKKGQPWLEKLRTTSDLGDVYAAVEIIPYEKLWEVMLGYLERK